MEIIFQLINRFFATTNMMPLLAILVALSTFAIGIIPFTGKHGGGNATAYVFIGFGPVAIFEWVTQGTLNEFPATLPILCGWLIIVWFIALFAKIKIEKEEKLEEHKEN